MNYEMWVKKCLYFNSYEGRKKTDVRFYFSNIINIFTFRELQMCPVHWTACTRTLNQQKQYELNIKVYLTFFMINPCIVISGMAYCYNLDIKTYSSHSCKTY